jgi:DNA-binding NarL/FixJ family response regulator
MMRVLLADDHEPLLREIQDLLKENFEVVGTAHNGLQMVTAAQKLKPDVIVSDIEMPEMSGIEAGRQVMKALPHVPIVLLTMHADRRLLEIALEAGFRGYVLKMHAADELIFAINEVTEGRIFVSPLLASQSDRV